MEFKILGPPELSEPGHPDLALSPQLWCVLVSLLITPDTAVPVDSLVDHLWDSDPPQMARETVRTYIFRINKLLGQHSALRIHSHARGYRLDVDRQTVDLHRFRSLKRQAVAVSESGDDRHAVALLKEADALWRGPALMGLTVGWAAGKREDLEEERYEAALLRIRLELALGHQAGLLRELRELAERHPYDEKIIEYEMIALYRIGRQADALQLGRETTTRFAELGMEPGGQLAETYERILRGDSELGVTPVYRRTGRTRQPNTLPPEPAEFTGREAEMEQLTADSYLGNAPLFEVIEGMPGVGKTALAVRVAHHLADRYPDAQLYLSFSEYDVMDWADALRHLLRMLDVPAARIPLKASERARLWRAETAHRRAVIVLDDVTDPEQVTPIVPAHGDCLIIAAARQHGAWPGNRVLPLEPLAAGDASMLLRRLIGTGTEHETAKVAEAARLCGGLPLAIRVAAGRIRGGDLTGLDGLIAELTDLHAPQARGGATGRHVFPAFERSYNQLTPAQKRLFRLLGDGPCADITLAAAAALTGAAEADTAAGLGALLDHYLLEHASLGRFRFHHLIRSYAVYRCAEDEQEPARRRAITRLMRYYSQTLDAANAVIQPPHDRATDADRNGDRPATRMTPADGHAWLAAEWKNILLTARYAARHELQRQCADLTHAMAGFLDSSGYWSEALAAHELALQACHGLAEPRLVARAALDASLASLRTADYGRAEREAAAAFAIYASAGDPIGQARALDRLGVSYRNSARFRDALAHHQEAIDLYREGGDRGGTAVAVLHTATALGCLGRYEEEIRHLGDALSIFREAGDLRGEAIALNNLGAVLDDRGFHRDAVAHYERSLEIFRRIGGRLNLAMLDQNMGRIQHYKGHYDEAIELYRKALATFYAIGGLQHQAVVLCDIGSAFRSMECYSEALVHHEKAAELARRIGDQGQLAAAQCGMGDAYYGSGSYPRAIEAYEKARRLAAQIEAPYLTAKALYGMAEAVLSTQGFGAAKIHWRKALDIFAQLGVPEAAIVELRLHGLDTSVS